VEEICVCAKDICGSEQEISVLQQCKGYRIYNGKVSAQKKKFAIPLVFRNPLRPIPELTICPSSPAAREPLSFAISVDLLRKRRVMMDNVDVSNVRERWTGC
jgi:hypothetical protein